MLFDARPGGALAQVPAPPTNVTAAKAYTVLERYCAGCHQAGRLETHRPGAGIANILALDEVALEPGLVRPGVPDASRLYKVALAREGHLDILNDPAFPEPHPSDVQALRDWIADLPPRTLGACSRRPRIRAEQTAQRLAAALSALDPTEAQQTRFLSLAALYNDCLAPADLDKLRLGIRELLAISAPGSGNSSNAPFPRAVDPEQLVFAFPLSRLGWSAQDWEEFTAPFPLSEVMRLPAVIAEATGTRTPVLPADWFAAAVLRRQQSAARDADGAPGAPTVWGLPAAEALRHAWEKPVDFHRAASDLWLEPAALATRLQRGTYDASLPARQLLSGSVARRERLLPLLAALATDTRSGRAMPPEATSPSDRLEIALWTEAATYRTGDTAVLNIATSRDCHLTLINVDRSGRAIVLFPNEFEPENLIRAGRVTKVPSFDSPYRFRFREKGRELAIALCSPTHKTPAGIVHDYDRQRFTSLGDWQLFLREPPDPRKARQDDAATETPRPEITQRRRGRRAPPPHTAPTVESADDHTRTAITIDIE
jgi:hypothetical protein